MQPVRTVILISTFPKCSFLAENQWFPEKNFFKCFILVTKLHPTCSEQKAGESRLLIWNEYCHESIVSITACLGAEFPALIHNFDNDFTAFSWRCPFRPSFPGFMFLRLLFFKIIGISKQQVFPHEKPSLLTAKIYHWIPQTPDKTMDTTTFPPSLSHCLVEKPQLAEKLNPVGWVSYFKPEMHS